ncbi:hypothetical protein GGI07_000279 [Coemansia sp. Benny D115]|nr:hypothetical protein GGI07_000279 [Coemansia sp. Benny D115]
MSSQPKAPLLAVKLPRHVVDKLSKMPAEELQLVLGGKERITTGTLRIGSQRFDVRYSAERSSAPPLLFQGPQPQPSDSNKWSDWSLRGKLVGKLTVINKNRYAAATASISNSTNTYSSTNSISTAATQSNSQSNPTAAALTAAAKAAAESASHARRVSAAKAAPQKKPGILRQNREMVRDHILHMLACGPEEELQILEKTKFPASVVLDTLGLLAQKNGSRWSLAPESFRRVQIDSWPKYDKQTREKVAENMKKAFDSLDLKADDPDRLRVEFVLNRLANGLPLVDPEAAESAGSAQTAKLKSPAVQTAPAAPAPTLASTPAVSKELANTSQATIAPPLPPSSSAAAASVPAASTPTAPPKKKPVRSVIAPTLSKKPRTGGPAGLSLAPSITSSIDHKQELNVQAPPVPSARAMEPPRPATRPTKPEGPTASTASSAKTQTGDTEDSAIKARNVRPMHLASAPSSLPNTAAIETATHQLLPNIGRKTDRRMREESDHHAASDAETEYRSRRKRAGQDNSRSPQRSRHRDITPSRSHSLSNRTRARGGSTGSKKSAKNNRGANNSDEDMEEPNGNKHVPVRSRPLQMQSLALSSSLHSPHVAAAADTGAAVSRVQERLAQEILADRRIPNATAAVVAGATADDKGKPVIRRSRGPSLSPIGTLDWSPTPLLSPQADQVPDTLEGLRQLQEQMVELYAEYSQLRLKIDASCAGLGDLSNELASASSAHAVAWTQALEERKTTEAEREEGEEIPGDVPLGMDSSLMVDVTKEKCSTDGNRLYVSNEADSQGDWWLADSPEALVGGHDVGKDGLSFRSRKLLPEEFQILRTTRTATDRYTESGGEDMRRMIKRYIHMHSRIEQMQGLLKSAYERVAMDLTAQYDALRVDLGDAHVDNALADVDGDVVDDDVRVLSIDMYRDVVPEARSSRA